MITKKFFLSLLSLINFNNVISIQEIEFKDNSLERQLNLLDMPEEIICNIIEQLIGTDKLDNIEKIKNAKDIFQLYSFNLIKFKRELIECLKDVRLTSHKLKDFAQYYIDKLKNRFEEKKQEFINEIKDQYADYDQNKLNSELQKIVNLSFNIFDFERDDLEKATKLIIAGADVNLKNKHSGYTVLIMAVEKNYKDIVELLLNHKDIDVNLKIRHINLTPLMIAVQQGYKDIAELLLNHKNIDVNLKSELNGHTALIHATIKGYKDIVELLLKRKDIDINIQNKDRQTALIIAAKKGHKEIVELLLKHKDIDVNIQDYWSNTALMWALMNGHIDIANLIDKKNKSKDDFCLIC